MNVSCDFQDPLPPVTKKRIKTRTWYVEVMLEVTSEVSDVTDDPDFDLGQRIKKILDDADQERIILLRCRAPMVWKCCQYIRIHSSDQIRDF